MGKEDLVRMARGLGIFIDDAKLQSRKRDEKYTNLDIIKLISAYYFNHLPEEKRNFALRSRLEIDTPSLAQKFHYLSKEEQDTLFNSEKWIAEPKKNGARMLMAYDPKEGFSFVGRNLSEVTFLPIDYTPNILLTSDCGDFHKGEYFKGFWDFKFILDCEIILPAFKGNLKEIQKFSQVYASEQNGSSAVLQMLTPESHKIQIKHGGIELHVFDILYHGDWCLHRNLIHRKNLVKETIASIQREFKTDKILMMEEYKTTEEKNAAWLWQLENKGEGLMFKNLLREYSAKEKRDKDILVKLKRSMKIANQMENKDDDIDAFIIGSVPSNPDKAYKHLIGGVKFGVYLNKEDGSQVEHHIATVGAMDLSLREDMTFVDPDGTISLNPAYLNKVCSINGQSISSKQLRFSHAESKFKFRTDKNPTACIMEEVFLKENII